MVKHGDGVDVAGIVRRQVILEAHDLAPDGTFAVVVRRTVRRDRYEAHLWLVPLTGRAKPRALTSGRVVDGTPRISPDGGRVAFTRTPADPGDEEATSRLLVVDLARPGARPVVRSAGRTSVGEVAWSPDGTRLAYTADADPPRFIVGPETRGSAPRARRITRLDWRYDEVGHLDRWSHAFVVEARGPIRPIQVTTGIGGASGVTWRPDGQALAYAADRRPDGDLDPRPSIWEAPVTGAGEPREILALRGPVGEPAYAPDGRWIAAIGIDRRNARDDAAPGVVVGPADGSAPAVVLAPDLDRPAGSWVDTDLLGWFVAGRIGPCWDADGSIVALVSDRGRVHPWRFPMDPATGRPVGDPIRLAEGDIASRSLAVGGGVISLLATVDNGPAELVTIAGSQTRGGAGSRAGVSRRTTMGSAWRRGLPWPEMVAIEVPGPGGPIETWIASPAGSGRSPLPTVVDVHGGPLGAWAPSPHLEVVLLCAAGYRVVLPNIRGSATYGGEWIRPQLGHWGEVDADDVHAALDHVVRIGLADPERLGVLGLSYGGFMVNWLVGTTDRFRAAVSENGVTNQVGAWANSDTGVAYNRAARMGDPLTPAGVRKLWRQSPLRHVAAVRTPLLMLQAEADRRCPAGDNEQFYTALRVLGRTVELVLYPDEYHVFGNAGRPDRRIDRHERMLEWFHRYLRS